MTEPEIVDLRIESDGTVHGSKVCVGDTMIGNVRSLTWTADADQDGFCTAVITFFEVKTVLTGQVSLTDATV